MNRKWQELHIQKIKNRAGNRYTPELNIDLPIAEIFDGLSRTKKFYASIQKHYGILKREFSHVSQKYDNNEIQKTYNFLKDEISQLLDYLKPLKKYNTETISLEVINKQVKKSIEILWKLSDKFRETKDSLNDQSNQYSSSEKFSSDIHHLHKVQTELRHFEEFSSSIGAKLANSPFLVLTGTAGTGKTHLLCDVVENRIKNQECFPSILVFGELFATNEEPFVQIIRQLELNIKKKELLNKLNKLSEKVGCRAIIAIDALNETKQKDFWKRSLSKVVKEIKKYPNIALVVSIRTGFEKEIIAKNLKNTFIYEKHRGFQFKEWEAVNKFFNEFQLPLPEVPLLTPEFQNPLFLLLFCKAFQNRKQNNFKKSKQIFKGHEGATYIFESFVNNISRRITKQFNIKNSNSIWDTIIKKIAAKMVEQNDDRITEEQIFNLVETEYPSINSNDFIMALEKNLLLFKIPRYSREKRDYDGFEFRFPFQKFSDHLIGRYLFKKYEEEFGVSNKNLKTAKKFFSKRRNLGKLLSSPGGRGIVEALSIQCPEYLKGYELIEVAPYLKNTYIAQKAFYDSLIWRKPEAFHNFCNIQDILPIIKAAKGIGIYDLINAILTVTPVRKHPFNAESLHNYLSKFSMARRDSWWSTFLHHQYGKEEAVDRLIEWAWSSKDKTYLNKEIVYLYSITLSWFLTTSNRFLRDKTTKALVNLLTDRLDIVLRLLKKFKFVNDPYIAERLYAIAYGCATRSKSSKNELKLLSQWIYDELFKKGNPPLHILLRDYARGVIEVAFHRGVKLTFDRKKIEPPFNSDWPETVPSEKILKTKYYPKIQKSGIWSSIMYNTGMLGDFGNYVINSNVDNWCKRKLNIKKVNRKSLFDNFKSKLTEEQTELFRKDSHIFHDVNRLRILFGDENISLSKKKESELAFSDFENSLPNKKRIFFKKEIKPFLNSDGSINDSLEKFDTGLAQRWVLNRVMQLGWQQTLHEKFDRDINTYYSISRSENKPERIGKKYQWIALHELLAMISDNFEFKDEMQSGNVGKYEGPWQIAIRDIDPSCTLKGVASKETKYTPGFSKYEIQKLYNNWNTSMTNSMWLKRSQDLPNPQKIIEFTDDQKNVWVTLEGFVRWQEETLPENEKYSLPTRTLWYMLKSYLVKINDKDKVFKWAKQQNFTGQWMPESRGFYPVYLGEYPWAPAFLYRYTPYYHYDRWTDQGQKIPVKVLVTDDYYLNSSSSKDCSTYEAIKIKLPAKFIVDEMNLVQDYMDGRFFDKDNDLVIFDPSIFHNNMHKQTLIRKDKLSSFLKHKNYALLWVLLGEKDIITMNRNNLPGRLEISGAYTLNNENKITGRYKSYFLKYK